jgi:hypothetical protein
MLYLGSPLEKVMDMINRELVDPPELKTMTNMIGGYANEVLGHDLEDHHIGKIEYKFNLKNLIEGVDVVGSIDMICFRKDNFKVVGFEHKSAKAFKKEHFIWLDEQPRMYYLVLQEIARQMNEKIWPFAIPIEVRQFIEGGGVIEVDCLYYNEVKKVQRVFEYQRIPMRYGEKEMEGFKKSFTSCCSAIKGRAKNDDTELPLPEPSFMGCQMCSFQNICHHFGYETPKQDAVMEEFVEEYAKREFDHLEEKTEREGGSTCPAGSTS